MRRFLGRIIDNIDALIALVLAGITSILGLVGAVSANVVSNAIVLTLSVFAFAIVRDRWKRESSDDEFRRSVLRAVDSFQRIPRRLDVLELRVRDALDTQTSAIERLGVKILTGSEISRALEEARGGADYWSFKGATGTYVRAITLPDCVTNARRNRRRLAIQMEILDPSDYELCERYARLFNSLAENPEDPGADWTGDGTRKEIYATILAACWYKQRFDHLEIQIGLSSVITTFRWDLSPSSLIITQRGPRFPAMLVEQGTRHYSCWSFELNTSLRQARKVPLERLVDFPLMMPTVSQVRALFSHLEIELPGEYGEREIEEIINGALHSGDPYAS